MYKIKLSNFIKWIFLQSYIVYNFSYPEMQFHFLINLEFKTRGTIIFTYENGLIQDIVNIISLFWQNEKKTHFGLDRDLASLK